MREVVGGVSWGRVDEEADVAWRARAGQMVAAMQTLLEALISPIRHLTTLTEGVLLRRQLRSAAVAARSIMSCLLSFRVRELESIENCDQWLQDRCRRIA